MLKYSFILNSCFLLAALSVSASQPTVHIIKKVDNPEHYETLAREHDILKDVFNGWEIASVSTPLEQNKIIFFYVNLLVPVDLATNGVSYEFGVWMKFSSDSLTNYENLKSVRMQLKEIISHFENHKSVRTFRSNTDVSSEYLYWNGGYIFEIRSDIGDTLVTATRSPASPEEAYVWRFDFIHPHLLDVLEIFLNNLYPISDILLFRDRVGIGHARKRESLLEISSGKNCYGSNACMTTYHSGQWITAYKLPLNFEWASFPFYAEARKEVLYYQLVESDFDCRLDDGDISGFVIMCHQQNRLARRIYFMYDCEKDSPRLISVQVDRNREIDPNLFKHELSTIDSLFATFGLCD